MNDQYLASTKANILVVDDVPANLRLLVGMLSDRGYSVRPVRDGRQALSIAREIPIDLILLDIDMPEMNGYEVCFRLKADEKTQGIPVIFLSALSDILDKVKAFEAGGVDYVTKPFQIEEVIARVETHLSLQSMQRSLQEKNNELIHKNQEIKHTLQQLELAQDELIQSEKMAAVGHLVAGIAHEINNPLGAISSSVHTIDTFLKYTLTELPQVFKTVSSEQVEFFLKLLNHSSDKKNNLSFKEKRKIKRELTQFLEEEQMEAPDLIADTLVDMNAQQDISEILPILKSPNSSALLEVAYNLSGLQRCMQTIELATSRASKIVIALKSYSHYDRSGEMIEADLVEGIETTLILYRNQLKQGVTTAVNAPKLPRILCYPDELNQVWSNLIQNSLQAMDGKGSLTFNIVERGDKIQVSVTDSGKGISPEILPKIFQPFFTTKPSGEGSGLGLDIVRKIVEKHQGTIEVDSQPGQTMFTVILPFRFSSNSRKTDPS
ncbi:MAG: response regulator [Cyanobacteriota bacterium]|nr:response regulator [Cyanobacteriota bacterium]